jgi:hypothetical protein
MTDRVRYEGNLLTAIRASDAAWVATRPAIDQPTQQARLDDLRAKEAALRADQALAWPVGATAISIVAGAVRPTVIVAPTVRVVVLSDAARK